MIFHNISGIQEFIITHDTQITIFLRDTHSAELDVRIILAQPGVHADIRIIHSQKDYDTLKLTTLQEHDAPHTSSSVIVKGVLYDHANFNYSGKIYVGPQARQTKAEQKSHTLLLSTTAFAQAVPALEVLTNEVQCKHGSAIAGINPKLLEYLTSRGIMAADAQDILVTSFLSLDT